jgi:hydrogenase maturation protease
MHRQTHVLIGLGNPVLGDDAVGLRVAEQVQRLLEEHPLPGARVLTSTRGGFELLDLLAGADAAIVVDCLTVPGGRPGTVRDLSATELAGCARLVGSHDVGLADVVELGRLLGLAMPDRLEIVGVEADLGGRIEENLSPPVARAVGPLAERLYRQLRESASSGERRPPPDAERSTADPKVGGYTSGV